MQHNRINLAQSLICVRPILYYTFLIRQRSCKELCPEDAINSLQTWDYDKYCSMFKKKKYFVFVFFFIGCGRDILNGVRNIQVSNIKTIIMN